MDEELRQYLAGMEERIVERTQAMETRIVGHVLERTQEMVREAETRIVDHVLERTQEMVRDAQTEILRGFERFLTGNLIRLRTLEADFSNLRTSEQLRLANLEERIQALELRLMGGGKPPNGKPPAE